ncbi:unnamed protein product [Larinioides sclopetarius]|uniref:Uncharacterized protein n=1 Tax=Larinioides sclopetarius TaxID=280406 RepID=A0AAV2BTM2_9ARAC
MQNDKVLYSEYCEILKGYLDEGIIEKVTSPFVSTNNPVFYLPHQVIIKKESLTTKLRIVFDASAHEVGQFSLNDCLFQEVNLNPNIFDLLTSFRLNKIAVLNDVEKAFPQISLAPGDKDVVRFLVASDKNDFKVYRFNRVIFGVNASPFLLAATIKTHIEKYVEQYPDTIRILDESFYVDDLVAGEDTVESAFDLSKTAAKMMNEAGMNLRITNNADLRKLWDLEHFDHLTFNDLDNQLHRVLGLLWNPQNDYFSLSLKGLLEFIKERKNTKRFLLMAAGRIFYPLGFIPRYILESDHEKFPECEIHTFSDSSIKAYRAVTYIRLKTPHKISVYPVASKSRVAPLKQLTLPCLELMGALLAARLAKEVSRVLDKKIPATSCFWTDSMIVLSWIQGPNSRWKVFVSSRVKEIQSLTNKELWHYCPGRDDPADLLTRGINADSLLNCEKWWNGPSFLHEEDIDFKGESVVLSDNNACHEELKHTERKALTVTLDNNCLNNILSLYINFHKILCVFSYLYRFIDNCRNPSNKRGGSLEISEIQRAETTLVKVSRSTFCSDYPHLCERPRNLFGFCRDQPHFCKGNISALVIPKLGYYAGYSSEVHKIAQQYLFNDTADAPPYLQRNSQRSFDDKKLIIDEDRPKPGFENLNTKTKTCVRRFHDELYEKITWLTACKSENLSLFSDSLIGVYKLRLPESESLYPWDMNQVFLDIHSPFLPVNPLQEGVSIRPGYHYFAEVILHKEQLLPYPYQTDCVDYNITWMKNNRTGPRSQDESSCVDPTIFGNICVHGREKLSSKMSNILFSFFYSACSHLGIPQYLNVCLPYVEAHERCHVGCKPDCLKLYYEYHIVESTQDPSPMEPFKENERYLPAEWRVDPGRSAAEPEVASLSLALMRKVREERAAGDLKDHASFPEELADNQQLCMQHHFICSESCPVESRGPMVISDFNIGVQTLLSTTKTAFPFADFFHLPTLLLENGDLFSYVGGLMGLWLGISVWNLLGMAEKFFRRSIRLKRKLGSHQEYVVQC